MTRHTKVFTGGLAVHSVGRRTLLAGAGSALALPAVHARAQSAGVALVIGNSKYVWESSLPNVKRDVADVARSFQALGLRTELLQDLGRDAMLQALDRFKAAAKGANFAALYFAGHGIVTGDTPATILNSIVPVDADLSSPAGAKSVLSVPSVVAAMEGASHRLGVFDSCRNNPGDGWRNRIAGSSGARGLTEHGMSLKYPPNTLLLFSTAPGYVAPDGPAGQNSPFAAAFLRQLAVPPLDLLTLPGRLRAIFCLPLRAAKWRSARARLPSPSSLPAKGRRRRRRTTIPRASSSCPTPTFRYARPAFRYRRASSATARRAAATRRRSAPTRTRQPTIPRYS